MAIEYRPIEPDRFSEFRGVLGRTFGIDPKEEDKEFVRRVFEFDRSIAAFDGSEIVGTGGAFSFVMTVPGGSLPTAGVTAVGVKPTHRRRGVLRGMMRHQLDNVRERGEPLAALWAAESSIYGRFGYGVAVEAVDLSIDRRHTEFAPPVDAPGSVRLVEQEEAGKLLPVVHDQIAPQVPGFIYRTPEHWQNRYFYDPEHWREGFSAWRYAVYEEGGEPLGFVAYRQKSKWEEGHAQGTLRVDELLAVTPDAYASLWQYCFGIDLVLNIEADNRPVDEPLPWMLADPRHLRRRTADTIWLRLVDVAAALAARRYAAEGRLILEVSDEFCPWNAGRYELVGGPDGADCVRTDVEPDITLGVAELGAVYLGGATFGPLQWAGRVAGGEEAIRRADDMFRWHVQPWCCEDF
ncbi:MAG: GNAT family N-acetyltransferase [Acidimicrobiia bacterium]